MTTPLPRRFLFAAVRGCRLRAAPCRANIDAVAVLAPKREPFRRSAPIDRLEALLDELLLDAIGLRVGLIHLVDRDDDRDVGRFDVRDRFFGLRHDAVVGRDDQNRHVGDFRAARAHGGEGFVTGRIDEGDLAIVPLDGVRADFCVMPPASPPRRWLDGSCRAARSCRGRRGRAP